MFGNIFFGKYEDIDMSSKTAAYIAFATALAGSNGLMEHDCMTVGLAIETREGAKVRIRGSGIVDGDFCTNNSTRGERGEHATIQAAVCHIA